MTTIAPKHLPLDQDACYAAMRAHDARFDGRFFCGVSSTGIYCRPICRVKLPKRENCSFFPSAAAAEAAGYRPCLRCRPELAPGLAPSDAAGRIARCTARLIEEDCLSDRSVAELAGMVGISDRHLRRVFATEFGVTPVQYLQTRRLLLAKSLLTDTALPVTEIAMSAGFGSIRRFNDLFLKRYRLAPSRFRCGEERGGSAADCITVFLAYRPPYAWQQIFSFLAARALPGVESCSDGCYRRTVALEKHGRLCLGWIAVAPAPQRDALAVTVSSALLPVLPQVLSKVKQLFDLDCDPHAVQEKLASLREVSPELPLPGIRLPGSFDSFESCIRAVLGQQVTVQGARTVAARLAAAFGLGVATPFAGLSVAFPLPETLSTLPLPIEERLGPLGIIGSRARTILALARGVADGGIDFATAADPAAVMERLQELPGVGEWTARYIAIRVLGWPDAFLASDYGVKKALAALPRQQALKLSESWSPWRSYATVSLWHALSAQQQRAKE